MPVTYTLTTFKGSSPDEEYDPYYRAKILRYGSTDEIPWNTFTVGERVRIVAGVPGMPLHLDALFIPRNHRDLIVLSHGALFQERVKFPYFQFVKSMVVERAESLLFIFDTTMLVDKEIFTSYYIGTSEQDLVSNYAQLVRGAKEQLELRRVVLAGHSAGGVASLMIGAKLPGSISVVSNPFIFDEHFELPHLENYRRAAFPECATVREMLDQYADRFYMRNRLKRRAEGSHFAWFVHRFDNSWRKHGTVKRLAESLEVDPFAPPMSGDDNLMIVNWEYPSSPHNMPFFDGKYSFLPLIEFVLDGYTKFDFKFLLEERDST